MNAHSRDHLINLLEQSIFSANKKYEQKYTYTLRYTSHISLSPPNYIHYRHLMVHQNIAYVDISALFKYLAFADTFSSLADVFVGVGLLL